VSCLRGGRMTAQNLDGLQRLALAAREAVEDRPLVFGQLFANDRDQKRSPRAPAIASKQPAEIAIA
jgi:hypothetical protein